MILNNRSIASRLVLMVALGSGGILIAIAGYSYFAVRALLMSELEIKARFMASATVNRIEMVERAVEKTVQGMAVAMELSPAPSAGGMYQLLRRMLADNPDIYGAAIALQPALELEGKKFNAPYVYRAPGGLEEKNLGTGNYRYDVWDWFNLPQKLQKPVWSEPYFDEGGGNILMVTYSVPVFRSNEFWGVVTSDISLEWLSELMAALSAGKGGYAWLVSANGTFITHPKRELIMNETVFSTAESHPDPAIREAGRRMGQRMIRGESDFMPFTSVVSGSEGWLFFAPIRASGWSLAVMFMREELMRQVFSLNRVLFVLGAAGIALLLAVAFGIARSITNPIRRLALATQALAGGNLDAPLPRIGGRDEVARLSGDFERMRTDLRQYIARLKETTAVRERIESELRIAHAIQMDLVPKTFPPFPSRRDLDIFGILDPAREVGGDFYDFYMPDDRRIFLFIGDVSGKGMPAALFMAVTRTLLKSIAREEQNPGLILARLNNELAVDNEATMFVTVFCAIVDLDNGACRFSNGGHNPPFILRQDGAVERLPLTNGSAVGVMPGLEFGEGSTILSAADTLFIYTDGVTEAMNPAGDMYGEERTVAELRKMRRLPAADVVRGMRAALSAFAAGAEQSDDVTMLVFQRLQGRLRASRQVNGSCSENQGKFT